jgi:hypothetical protein
LQIIPVPGELSFDAAQGPGVSAVRGNKACQFEGFLNFQLIADSDKKDSPPQNVRELMADMMLPRDTERFCRDDPLGK